MKVVLELDVHKDDSKCKQLAIKAISKVRGIDSVAIAEGKMTLTGSMDPVEVVQKLRKVFHPKLVSAGPAKEPEKKKEEPEKKTEKPKIQEAQIPEHKPRYPGPAYPGYPPRYPGYPPHYHW